MKMKSNVLQLFNEQIKHEYESGFLYLSMSQWLNQQGLPGAANWMQIQYHEEMVHAEGLYRYLAMRGEVIELNELAKPKKEWDSALQVFEEAYEHEKFITGKINHLAKVAEEAGDRAAVLFLDWYVLEQVEEEANADENVSFLKLARDNRKSMFDLDRIWAERVFNAEPIPHLD